VISAKTSTLGGSSVAVLLIAGIIVIPKPMAFFFDRFFLRAAAANAGADAAPSILC